MVLLKFLSGLNFLVFFTGIVVRSQDSVTSESEITESEEIYNQVATFDGEVGITGTVRVFDKGVLVDLNLSQVDLSLLPNEDCLESLSYSLHTSWEYEDSDPRIGSEDCGSSYTGGRYDPLRACSPESSNKYCSNLEGCIETSGYECDSEIFRENPYACEVGDWSGKYGLLELANRSSVRSYEGSAWEVETSEIENASVVFSCGNTGEVAFCASLQLETYQAEESEIESYERQRRRSRRCGGRGRRDSDRYEASFGQYGRVILEPDSFHALVTLTEQNSSCSEIGYAIFNDWDSETNSSMHWGDYCMDAVGSVMDPTHACDTPWSDSEYCDCGLEEVESSYSAVGSLSDVYGTFTVGEPNSVDEERQCGILPPAGSLEGGSIGFFCIEDLSFVMCASLEERSRSRDDRDSYDRRDRDDDSSSSSSSSSDEDEDEDEDDDEDDDDDDDDDSERGDRSRDDDEEDEDDEDDERDRDRGEDEDEETDDEVRDEGDDGEDTNQDTDQDSDPELGEE